MRLSWIADLFRPRTARSSGRRGVRSRPRTLNLESLEGRALPSAFTWTGTADTNWSNSGNWSVVGSDSDGLPDGDDDVTFSGTPANNSVVNQAFTVKSVTIDNTYTGSVSLNADLTSLGGFSQAAGTFDANASTLTSGKGFTVSGGTFDPDAGTVTFNAPMNFGPGTINAAGVTFNNVNINYGSNHVNVGGGLHVNGDLTINGYNTITGDIHAAGNVTTSVSAPLNISSGTLYLDGAGAQTLTGTGDGALPLVVNQKAPSSTLTLTGSITPENWTQVSGKLSAVGSTTTFRRSAYGATVDTGTTSLGNVVVDAGSMHFRIDHLNVNGNLTIQSATDFLKGPGAPVSGVVTVTGDLTSTDASVGGTADITMVGAANASITGGDFPNGGIIINKLSGSTVTANVTQPLDGPLSLINLGILQGTFQVGGNVTTSDTGISGNSDGSPVLVFKGNSAQTLTANVANGAVPGLEFDKSGGSFTLANNANVLQVTGGWIVDNSNVAPINLTGTNVRFLLSGGYGSRTIDTGMSAGFNDVELTSGSGSTLTIPKMIVDGQLSIVSVGVIAGTIDAHGDVSTSDTSVTSGPGTILFNGTGNQVLTATVDDAQVPNVAVNKTAGTLSFGTNRIGVTGDWTYTKGTVNSTGSTISFQGYGSRTVTTGVSPAMSFYNVDIFKGSGDTLTVANKLTVNNDLTIRSIGTLTAATGAITVGRNLTSTDTSVGGTTDITMVGTANATITGGDFPNGGIIINKGSAQTVTANVTTPLDGPLNLKSMSALLGTFQVGANVTTSDNYAGLSGNSDGSPVLVFKGNKAQTLTANVANGTVPGLEFDKSGGSFTLVSNANVSGANALLVTGGWIVNGTNAAPINLTGTNVKLGSYSDRTIDTGTSAGFDNVDISVGSGDDVTIGTMVVNGNLTLSSASTISGGNIDVYGNVTTQSMTSMGGTSRIHFVGSANQTLAATADDRRMLGVIIEKSGGTLTIDSTHVIDVTGNWDYIGTGSDVTATGSTIKFVGSTKYIRSGAMRFYNVNFAVGSADHVEVLDAGVNPGILYYSGTVTNAAKVTVGILVFAP